MRLLSPSPDNQTWLYYGCPYTVRWSGGVPPFRATYTLLTSQGILNTSLPTASFFSLPQDAGKVTFTDPNNPTVPPTTSSSPSSSGQIDAADSGSSYGFEWLVGLNPGTQLVINVKGAGVLNGTSNESFLVPPDQPTQVLTVRVPYGRCPATITSNLTGKVFSIVFAGVAFVFVLLASIQAYWAGRRRHPCLPRAHRVYVRHCPSDRLRRLASSFTALGPGSRRSRWDEAGSSLYANDGKLAGDRKRDASSFSSSPLRMPVSNAEPVAVAIGGEYVGVQEDPSAAAPAPESQTHRIPTTVGSTVLASPPSLSSASLSAGSRSSQFANFSRPNYGLGVVMDGEEEENGKENMEVEGEKLAGSGY